MEKALIAALMAWTAEASGLPLPEEPPIVVVMPHAVMVAEDPYGSRFGHPPVGLYFHGEGFVYLHEDRPAGPAGLSVLVHELVHYLQDANGLFFGCTLPLEPLAHRVQAMFLAEHGIQWNPEPELDRIGAVPGACNP